MVREIVDLLIACNSLDCSQIDKKNPDNGLGRMKRLKNAVSWH